MRLLHPAIGEPRDRPSARIGVGEGDQPGHLERVLGDGVVGHLGDEAERSLRADDQVDEDVDRVVEVDQRVDRVADGVLDGIFFPDQFQQRGIGTDFRVQCLQFTQQPRVRHPEFRDGVGIAQVEHRAVGEHHPEPVHGVIGVVRDAAAHARRVVVHHPADLAGRLARRVRPELGVERLQRLVGIGDDHRRAERNPLAGLMNLQLAPAVAEHRQHPVGDRLAAQRGARSAESQRQPLGPRRRHHRPHLVLGVDDHHHRRHQAVRAGIARIGVGHHRIGHDPVLADHPLEPRRHPRCRRGPVHPDREHLVHVKTRPLL